MARIAGINIPVNKHVWVGLTHIYGIGRTRALAACKAANVEPSTRVRDLTEPEVNALRAQVSRYMVEGDLRRENSMSLKRLDGPRRVPRHPPPQGPAGEGPAHAHQCAHAQGPASRGRED